MCRDSYITSLKKNIRVLNHILALIVFIVLLLVVRFVHQFLNYIPLTSAVTLLALIAVFSASGYVLSRNAARKAFLIIDEYSSKLNALLSYTKAIHELGHSDEVFRTMLDVSMGLTGADGGRVSVMENGHLVLKTARGDAGSVPVARAASSGAAGAPPRSLRIPLASDGQALGVLHLVKKDSGTFTPQDGEIMSYFTRQATLSLERTRFYEDKKNYEIQLTNILVELQENISEKHGHARRVAKYALLMADALSFSDADKERLYRASLFHDIGFLRMATADITSPEDYKSHSQLGYDMLRPINFYADILPAVLHHHERYDGRGYPAGLAGESIPLEARMLAITEAFDAMVSRHSYKTMGRHFGGSTYPTIVEFETALQELRENAGTQFDPHLVEVFLGAVSDDDMEL